MKEPVIYLDSSAIIKRYIKEPGSEFVRNVYLKAYSGEVKLAFSIWNIGEVLSALDKARRLGRLEENAYILSRKRFLAETMRLLKHKISKLVPIKNTLLIKTWSIQEKYHIYVADALQIASAKTVNAQSFVTGDGQLHGIANKEGLNAILAV